jgi:hypothetical protein
VTVESPVAFFEIADNDAMLILEHLLTKMETEMDQAPGETREHFMNRERNLTSLIGIFAEIVGKSTRKKEGEYVTVKVVFSG